MQQLRTKHVPLSWMGTEQEPPQDAEAIEAAATLEAELMTDLVRYPLRKYRTLFWLWLVTGIVGGHRYYLGQTVKGALMTISYGGMGLWWLRDGMQLRKLLNQYNSAQMARRTRQEPPLEMAYLPALTPDVWQKPYAYAAPAFSELADRNPRTLRGDLVVVVCISLLVAYVCHEENEYEPLVAVFVLLSLLNLRAFRGESWLVKLARRSRIVRESLQWELKLRLFYHAHGVPKPSQLLFRPFTSFVRLFQPKHAGEAQLYLEASYLLSAVFSALNLLDGTYIELLSQGEFAEAGREWLMNNLLVLFLVYAFVTPLGATLMKFDLTHPQASRDRFILSAVALLALGWGLVRIFV